MALMRAVIPASGACALVERALPSLAAGQLLLRVAYSAVNRADTLQRRGLYPPPPGSTDILGLEAVGTVAGLGEGVGGPALGSRLMALLPGGGNAEYVAVQPSHCLPVPASMSLRDAAALPETWLTAFQLLFVEGSASRVGLPGGAGAGVVPLAGALAGAVVVVHAAGSGVGTAAVQLAAAAGAHVVAVAGSSEKLAACAALGAAAGVNYKEGEGSFAGRLKAAVTAGGRPGAALILDPVGATFAAANAEALALDGTWVLYGSMGGLKLSSEAAAADSLLGALLRKRARLLGTTLRNRSDAYKAELVSRFAAAALPGFEGAPCAFKPVIFAELPLEEAGKAHELMEGNGTLGKIILRVATEA